MQVLLNPANGFRGLRAFGHSLSLTPGCLLLALGVVYEKHLCCSTAAGQYTSPSHFQWQKQSTWSGLDCAPSLI